MGLSATQRQRLPQLDHEAKESLGGCHHPDGRPMTFSKLEDECIEFDDSFTALVLEQRVSEAKPNGQPPYCPGCERAGECQPAEPRVLQADRGEVGWLEPSYYCRNCRRSFFPAVR